MAKAPHLTLGSQGEQLATQHLRSKGMAILHTNWRPNNAKSGLELDIIAQDKKTLVFVEVKTRSQEALKGEAYNAFSQQKQTKLVQAATHYLQQYQLWDSTCRFDLITLLALADGNFTVEHYTHVIELGHLMDSCNAPWQPW